MTQRYSIRPPNEEEPQGPFTLEELASLVELNQIDEETLYYHEPTDQWLPLASNDELQRKVLSSPKIFRPKALIRTVFNFLDQTIWHNSALHDKSLKGRLYALLRVLSIILNGFSNNHLLSRSAALSYYSLIALGPLVAIVVMISGFILQRSDADLATRSLERMLLFIAPPVAELSKLPKALTEEEAAALKQKPSSPQSPTETPASLSDSTDAPDRQVFNEDLITLINNFIQSTQSGTVGIIGTLLLIAIGIQLLTSIESTFNEIWGVRQGRSWIQRIVFYWTFISLGSVLGFAAVTALSAAALAQFFDLLPFGQEASSLFSWMGPLFSFLIIMGLLSAFYRFIPNTTVQWRAAWVGAIFVTLLLLLNNTLSFIYVHRVISQQSLYGSLGIVPVLMIGLYIFWFFVLMGGQITYSIQNTDSLSHQQAWNNISAYTQEILSLTTFLVISRRFKNCQPAYSASDLSATIRVPQHILNTCLNHLSDLHLINAITSSEETGENRIRYQPACPLDQITLGELKQALEGYGNNEGTELIHHIDPLIDDYREKLKRLNASEFGQVTIESLLEKNS